MTTQTEVQTHMAHALPAAATQRADLALLLLRLATGIIFVMHGYQKFFAFTIPGTVGAFTKMGVPLPTLSAPLVATVELLGGLLLILGLFSRWAAALLAFNILGAILLVHLKAGFFSPAGFEFPMLLLVNSIALALFGPGRFSLNRR